MIGSIFAHITCRINTRLFVQKVDLKPGIISQHDLAGHLTDGLSLDHSILLEAFSILINVCMDSGLLQGKDLKRRICQDPADLFHFPLISGGKNNLFHYFILPFFGGRGPRN